MFSDNGFINRRSMMIAGMQDSSFFFRSGSLLWLYTVFGFWYILTICMLVGFKTNIVTPMAYFMFAEFIRRFPMVGFGSDQVMSYLLLWGSFMNWGARFSFDSWFENAELDPSLHDNKKLAFNVGTVGHTVSFFFMYLNAGVLKFGDHWRKTSKAVQIALLSDFYAGGPIALFFVNQLPEVCNFLTDSTLYLEVGGAVLMQCPILFDFVRAFTILNFAALQTGFILTMNLGFFPYCSIATGHCLMPRGFVDYLISKFETKERMSARLIYDPKSARARYIAYFCQTFLLHPSTEVQPKPKHFKKADERWGIVSKDGSESVTGSDAVSQVLSLSPLIPLPFLVKIFLPLINVYCNLTGLIPAYDSEDDQEPVLKKRPKGRTSVRRIKTLLGVLGIVCTCLVQGAQTFKLEAWKKSKAGPGENSGMNVKTTPLEENFNTAFSFLVANIAHPMFVVHDWGLFGPEPPMEDYYNTAIGTLVDGNQTNVLMNKHHFDWHGLYDPKEPQLRLAELAATQRMHVWFKGITEAKNKWKVCEYSFAFCNWWNRKNPDRQLESIKWKLFVRSMDVSHPTQVSVNPEEKEHFMWFHTCQLAGAQAPPEGPPDENAPRPGDPDFKIPATRCYDASYDIFAETDPDAPKEERKPSEPLA